MTLKILNHFPTAINPGMAGLLLLQQGLSGGKTVTVSKLVFYAQSTSAVISGQAVTGNVAQVPEVIQNHPFTPTPNPPQQDVSGPDHCVDV